MCSTNRTRNNARAPARCVIKTMTTTSSNHLVSCPCVRNATLTVCLGTRTTVKVEETNVNRANKLRTDITAPNIMSKTSARKDMQIETSL